MFSEGPEQLPVPFRGGIQKSKLCQWHGTFSKSVQDSENWDFWQNKQMLAQTDVILSGTKNPNIQYSKLKPDTL